MTQVVTPIPSLDITPLRTFFNEGGTRPLKVRLQYLEALEKAIQAKESLIIEALRQDLGKSQFEAYATEVGFVLDELSYIRRNLPSWVRPRRLWPSLAQLPGQTELRYEPRGVVLILSPWNYPFQLLLSPLVGAIAAGNVVVLKPSEFAPATAKVVEALINEVFPPEYVRVVQGDAKVAAALVEEEWDYIFFTGSTRIGRLIAEVAAKRLIPYTLELGGKSPAIVEADAAIALAARRIAWGKWLNAGQTCIAPDYVLVQESRLEPFLQALKEATHQFYGSDLTRPPADYARIIHANHYNRLVRLLQEGEVVFGGHVDAEALYISPTVLLSPRGELLEEEIFGPLLPVIPYSKPEDAVAFVRRLPPPLAVYVFSESPEWQAYYLDRLPSGGACINDTLIHIASPRLPFGGVRQSGIGRYHGWYSFETFSHARAVVKTPTWLDLPLRYPPYTSLKQRLLRWLLG
ncbi:MAG: aldehyde dehydrogenase family protein [Bacteroidia bacterium]|nr:aldehyde dehydrogenase family protein [Bacteroidia bacterium]MDW8088684.1 aldehyde dehydrogenase family protein [Bacteroidia bacterium]